jgi:hypothetical protein
MSKLQEKPSALKREHPVWIRIKTGSGSATLFGVSFLRRVMAPDSDLDKFPYLLEVLDPDYNVKRIALPISKKIIYNIFTNARFHIF